MKNLKIVLLGALIFGIIIGKAILAISYDDFQKQEALKLFAPQAVIERTVANFVTTEIHGPESSDKTIYVTMCDGTTWESQNSEQAEVVEAWLLKGLKACNDQ